MKPARFFGPFALSALLVVRAAGAQEAVDPQPLPPAPAALATASAPPGSGWYGWQTLISDGATAATTIALSQLTNASAFGLVGANAAVGFGLGAPAIHLAHGRPLVALADLAMRAGSVFLGGFLGEAALNCHTPPPGEDDHGASGLCQVFGVAVGGMVGATAATVVDASALSWEPNRAPGRATTVGQSFTVEPTVTWSRDGAAVGLQGRF